VDSFTYNTSLFLSIPVSEEQAPLLLRSELLLLLVHVCGGGLVIEWLPDEAVRRDGVLGGSVLDLFNVGDGQSVGEPAELEAHRLQHKEREHVEVKG